MNYQICEMFVPKYTQMKHFSLQKTRETCHLKLQLFEYLEDHNRESLLIFVDKMQSEIIIGLTIIM